MKAEMKALEQSIYPVEVWNVTENVFRLEDNYRNETTFALSNGYIGTRGTFEECYDFPEDIGLEGNFINGFYESEEIKYGEWNYGFPTKSQSLLNLPNGKGILLYVGDELFDMRKGKMQDYERVLHMKEGFVSRNLTWTSERGATVRIETKRYVSLENKNQMAVSYTVIPLNYEGSIRLVSILDADVENHTRVTNPLVDYGPFGRRLFADCCMAQGEELYYEGTTKNSKLTMACGCQHQISGDVMNVVRTQSAYNAQIAYELNAVMGQSIVLEKYIIYVSQTDVSPTEKLKKGNLEKAVHQKLKVACQQGFAGGLEKQAMRMQEFWDAADVQIEGDDSLQQGIRFNLFHIMQSAGRDGKCGMGAKGLTGEGYEGHYFWDTEMYVLPVFIYTDARLARQLLNFRYEGLDKARERARVLGHEKGALYPWRTINGEEASTYYPLGTAQYHINADIAYAFSLYVQVTGDYEYLKEKAAEVLCETARVFADVGCFAESRDDRYCICSVTGPDEYNAIVDNNFYTNLMARENIRDAVEALAYLEEHEPLAYSALIDKISLEQEEIMLWKQIVERMYFPYDEGKGVYLQDDGFMQRKPWDDSKIPPEKRHLLYENYHPLFIFRQRMSKQADAILGMYLHSNLFTKEELEKNYDFYQEVTLHHSSLSTCIFGIVACMIGKYEEAYPYFQQSARMDLDDAHHNFYAGIHAANMAGTWLTMINGFAGLRTNGGKLEFTPFLPNAFKAYQFRVKYRGSFLEIRISTEQTCITLLNETGVRFTINGKEQTLSKKGEHYIETI